MVFSLVYHVEHDYAGFLACHLWSLGGCQEREQLAVWMDGLDVGFRQLDFIFCAVRVWSVDRVEYGHGDSLLHAL